MMSMVMVGWRNRSLVSRFPLVFIVRCLNTELRKGGTGW